MFLCYYWYALDVAYQIDICMCDCVYVLVHAVCMYVHRVKKTTLTLRGITSVHIDQFW